jgi:nucleotide-binding universal stress UspA family protein
MKMKKVLIALDYNPTAQKIAEAGYDLAKAMNARTVLLHVLSEQTYYASLNYSPVMGFDGFSSIDPIQADPAEELKEAAQSFLDKAKMSLGDDRIETIVSRGDLGDMILETAIKLNVDVIVLGTHSQHGLEKIWVGSVTEKVLHHSRIPLFIIPLKGMVRNK